jgi:hypothetical protein
MAAPEQRRVLTSGLSLTRLIRALTSHDRDLSAVDSASTLFRFFRSKHVVDLKVIVTAALLIFVLLTGLLVVIGWADVSNSNKATSQQTVDFFKFFIGYLGPTLGVGGLIVGWAYRSASARLGVVDLFACEISTLCRVGTIFDVGKIYIDQYNKPPKPHDGKAQSPAPADQYVAEEHYFPVFDNNARDLQLLEALVVKNITEFYTYMKAIRDAQRKLALIPPDTGGGATASGAKADATPWQAGLADVIYLLFLGYESARKAGEDLIEFQPMAAETTITILLTELCCYAFLLGYFAPDDVRHARLKLREGYYRDEVPKLCDRVEAYHGPYDDDWLPAKWTVPELRKRHRDLFGAQLVEAQVVVAVVETAPAPVVALTIAPASETVPPLPAEERLRLHS